MRYPTFLCAPALTFMLLAGCHAPVSQMPGDRDDHQPWHGIATAETVRFVGTEPFWSGEVTGASLVYRTPENQDGERVAVTRFAGRGGLSFNGKLAGGGTALAFTLAVTTGECSDGMSDRLYPFTAMLRIGSEVRQGCAWTDRQPFSGDNQP